MSRLGAVGKEWHEGYLRVSQNTIAKFGKIWNESRPQCFLFPGLRPGGSVSVTISDTSQGPNRPLRITRSIGLYISGGRSPPAPPLVEPTRCAPSIWKCMV